MFDLFYLLACEFLENRRGCADLDNGKRHTWRSSTFYLADALHAAQASAVRHNFFCNWELAHRPCSFSSLKYRNVSYDDVFVVHFAEDNSLCLFCEYLLHTCMFCDYLIGPRPYTDSVNDVSLSITCKFNEPVRLVIDISTVLTQWEHHTVLFLEATHSLPTRNSRVSGCRDAGKCVAQKRDMWLHWRSRA